MSSTPSLSITLRAIDHLTAPLRRMNAQIESMQAPVRGLGSTLNHSLQLTGISRMSSGLASVGREVGALGFKLAALGGAGAFAFKHMFIDVAAEYENLAVALEASEGSAEKGKKAMAWITEFAKKTPLELDTTTKAYTMLKNAGIEPTNGSLMALVDANAKMNGSQDDMIEKTRQVGQAWMKNKLQAEYLERWSNIWGINRIAASFATGSVTLTGTNGVIIPAGTELQRSDGVLYATDADVTIASGTATAVITAIDAGKLGNAAPNIVLTLTSPIAGISSTAITVTFVAGANWALDGGADAETDTALRSRFIARIRQPPHGGAKFDYEAWALQVAGVTRVWIFPQELGAGTLTVRFVRDNDASLIPDSNEVATVQAYIDNLRPVTAQVTVVAPVEVPLNLSIALTPNNTTVKAAVTAELADLISREAIPGGTLYLSHIRAAISAAAGETNYTMSAPNADVTNTTGNMTTLGAITWL